MMKLQPSEQKIVLLYKRNAEPDEQVLQTLEAALTAASYKSFVDRHLSVGVRWAAEIEKRIRESDTVIAVLSDAALASDMILYELETVADQRRKAAKPLLLPIRIGGEGTFEGPWANYLNQFHFFHWKSAEDDASMTWEVLEALASEEPDANKDLPLEPAGGAVSPTSRFYVVREADIEVETAIKGKESVVLLRGPRQIGKTSLLGRGAHFARELGYRQVSTDFQMASSEQFQDPDRFYKMLAATIARQLGFRYDFDVEWLDVFGPNMNLANFLRAVLNESDEPLVWFMDEADRLFTSPFASDYFGLVRSWHNARATDPTGPWERLTLVIAYASEARLFIRDLNQSPFNVGRQVAIKNFTLEQTLDLNQRYGEPMKRSQAEALQFLVAGHPFLTRRAMEQVASGAMDFAALMENSTEDDGPFGDHLKRMLIAVSQSPAVLAALAASLEEVRSPDSDAVNRLVSAGVLKEISDERVEIACDLYAQYLERHLQ